jgi:hypothetical protein
LQRHPETRHKLMVPGEDGKTPVDRIEEEMAQKEEKEK